MNSFVHIIGDILHTLLRFQLQPLSSVPIKGSYSFYATGPKSTSMVGYVKFCMELDHMSGAPLVITIKPKVACLFRPVALLLFLNSAFKQGIIFSIAAWATFRTPIATQWDPG
jgi:hypothetical protein